MTGKKMEPEQADEVQFQESQMRCKHDTYVFSENVWYCKRFDEGEVDNCPCRHFEPAMGQEG